MERAQGLSAIWTQQNKVIGSGLFAPQNLPRYIGTKLTQQVKAGLNHNLQASADQKSTRSAVYLRVVEVGNPG